PSFPGGSHSSVWAPADQERGGYQHDPHALLHTHSSLWCCPLLPECAQYHDDTDHAYDDPQRADERQQRHGWPVKTSAFIPVAPSPLPLRPQPRQVALHFFFTPCFVGQALSHDRSLLQTPGVAGASTRRPRSPPHHAHSAATRLPQTLRAPLALS